MTFKKEFKHTEQWKKQHSERMKGKGNPMFDDPREDLQIKFKGEGNPMFGKDPWNLGLTKETNESVKIVSDKLKNIPKSESHKIKLSNIKKEWFRLHPDVQSGDKNPMKNPESRKACSESIKEYYRLHPEAIKIGEEHWSYGKPSPKLHLFSALDHLIKDKYCILFNNKLKEQVRLRDSHTCQFCNKTQQQERKRLSVHHVHYDKPDCYPDLITLCNVCNIKANKLSERKNWEKYYMNKLNDRSLLFWTKRRNKSGVN